MGLLSFLGLEAEPQLNGHEPAAKFGVEVPSEIVAGDRLAALADDRRITRTLALQVPAVLRARNLIAGTLARLPVHVRDSQRRMSRPTSLLEQIDPDVANVVTYANTYEDLLFEGIAWWRVTEFDSRGFPSQAMHVPKHRVLVSGGNAGLPATSQLRGTPFPEPGRVFIDGIPVSNREVIRFDSPNPPLLVHAARAIRVALILDKTASLYSETPFPLGAFTPKEGVADLDEDEVEALVEKWEQSRQRRAWGYVGAAWDIKQLQFDAEQIQLAEQRQHAVLEIARATGIDPEDLGVSTTSRTYQNSEHRRQDLLDFTLAAYMSAVEQRLSMNDVLPRGHEAKVNLDGFLRATTVTRMRAHRLGLEVGAVTEDEIRELEDRPALTDAQRDRLAELRSGLQPSPDSGADDE